MGSRHLLNITTCKLKLADFAIFDEGSIAFANGKQNGKVLSFNFAFIDALFPKSDEYLPSHRS